MKEINCPICEQDNTESIFKKGNLDKDLFNVICRNCGLVFINPRPEKEEYDKFHEAEFLSEKAIVGIEQVESKLNDSDLRIKTSIFNFLDEYLDEGKKVLDIGCGFGRLLNIIKREKKVDVFGVELGNLDVEAAKKYYGLDAFHGSLEEFAKNQENWDKFDVIIMHHVLEHLPEPLVSLCQIKKLLKSEGVLYIGVPNVMNIKKRPDIFFQQAHPFSYSPYSLSLLLQKSGFGILKFNRKAGYPGGMEMLAMLNIQNKLILKEGADYSKVREYVLKTENKFKKLRNFRERIFFWLPKKIRMKFSRIIGNILKNM